MRRIAWNKGLTKLDNPNLSKSGVKKGNIPWNKGKKMSPEQREKLRLAHLGVPLSKEHRDSLSKSQIGRVSAMKGKKHNMETRKKMSNAHKGEKAYQWKGGITPQNRLIRHSLEYRIWREAVFARDNWTCVIGGEAHGSELNADHIKPFSLYPELRFAIDNGRTLCKPCHRQTETWGFRGIYARRAE